MLVQRTTSDHPDFQELSGELEQDLRLRDGDQHEFYAELNKIDRLPNVLMVYINEQPVGSGAIRDYDGDSMEIKRMYVKLAHRKQGIAGAILAELETWAKELGYTSCILETGKNQPEAIALYKKHNYSIIPNFGKYTGSENSVCFRKRL